MPSSVDSIGRRIFVGNAKRRGAQTAIEWEQVLEDPALTILILTPPTEEEARGGDRSKARTSTSMMANENGVASLQGHGRAEPRERPKTMTQIAVEISCIFRFDFIPWSRHTALSGREKHGGKPSRPADNSRHGRNIRC
jgi:hypothetical protein